MYVSQRGLLETNPALAWGLIILILVVVVLAIAGMWKTFTKAGKPGWAAIIPIYNNIVAAEIAGKPVWYGVIAALGSAIPIPFVGFAASLVFSILICMPLAEKFGKSQGFGVLLALFGFIMYPILGFGDAQYEGGNADSGSDEILDV